MKNKSIGCLFLIIIAINPIVGQTNLDSAIDNELSNLVTTYKTLHAAPEISGQEQKTTLLTPSLN